jgi:hypothetical protein
MLKDTKKDIMNVINVTVLVDKNKISYFKINGNEKDFMNNLCDLGL